jgi:hypothetical protein
MSYCRFVPRALNLLSRGTTTLSTGSAASGYPLTYLYDGKPSTPLLLQPVATPPENVSHAP